MKKIALLGYGNVGQGVYAILDEQQPRLSQAVGCGMEVAAILVRNRHKKRDISPDPCLLTDSLDAVLAHGQIDAVADTTGDTALGYRMAKAALEQGIHFITAGKTLVSRHMEELSALAERRDAHFLYEASVAGGIPLLKPLRKLSLLGDVSQVRGIINGSCNHILTGMSEEGRTFSDMMAEAKALGYLEADPSDDINGWDTRRKLRILATLAFGGTVQEDDIPCEGIAHIRQQDIRTLQDAGRTLRLLGRAKKDGDRVMASVFPCALATGDTLSGIRGVSNHVEVKSAYVGWVGFSGPGAGRYPTAHAMVSDLVDALSGRKSKKSPLGSAALTATGLMETGVFYLRGDDLPHGWAERRLGNGWLTHPVALGDVMAWLQTDAHAVAVLMA